MEKNERRLESDLRQAGVPKRYQTARFADYPGLDTPHINNHGLFLSGAVGRGKTHLAAAILAAMIPGLFEKGHDSQRYLSAKWINVPELLLELRETFGNSNKSERAVIYSYCRPQLLVIDDLGAEKTTDWTGQSVYTIVSRRINDCKPTIVTSNLSLTEIHATDPRLASRLGGMERFHFDGEDRRLI